MKDSIGWVTAIISLIIGTLLIVFHNHMSLMTWIVEAIGVLIVVPAVWVILVNAFGRRHDWLSLIVAVIALGLGAWICCSPEFFAQFIIYVFAVVLLLSGGVNFFSLSHGHREVRVPLWLYIVPAVVIVIGLVLLFTALRVVTGTIVLIVGVALVVTGANALVDALRRLRQPSDD